ncbi:unnamed protein product [Ixodes hexagonus]
MSNFILVHYDDDISEVVPIGYVKNKEAENVKKHGKYKNAWCEDIDLKNQEPPEGVKYYKGVVLQLIETLKEAQSLRSTGSAEAFAAGAKESVKTLGKTQKANAAQGQVTNWDEILKAHNKEFCQLNPDIRKKKKKRRWIGSVRMMSARPRRYTASTAWQQVLKSSCKKLIIFIETKVAVA